MQDLQSTDHLTQSLDLNHSGLPAYRLKHRVLSGQGSGVSLCDPASLRAFPAFVNHHGFKNRYSPDGFEKPGSVLNTLQINTDDPDSRVTGKCLKSFTLPDIHAVAKVDSATHTNVTTCQSIKNG